MISLPLGPRQSLVASVVPWKARVAHKPEAPAKDCDVPSLVLQACGSFGFAGAVLLCGVLVGVAVPALSAGEKGPKPKAGLDISKGNKKIALIPGCTANRFDFETEKMRGTLRLDGDYHGVVRLVDKRTNRQVVDPRYSLLNLFRIFSVNLGLGTPRSMKGTIKSTSDMAEVTWPASEVHQGEITARYEVKEPNIVDLTITVRSRGVYPAYEILLPSYFDSSLLPHVYLKRRTEGGEWVLPTFNEVFRGGVMAFPRDAHAARRYVDGRWTRGEYGMPCAPFFPLRPYAEALGLMTDRDQQVGIALMAQRQFCSGVSCRYHADQEADRLTSYSAIDLTLFGQDLNPGDECTALVRLVLLQLDGDLNRVLPAFRAFTPTK